MFEHVILFLSFIYVIAITHVLGSRNRQLISSYIKAHPLWSDAFDALVAKASKPDHSGGYGTVYEKDKGFI